MGHGHLARFLRVRCPRPTDTPIGKNTSPISGHLPDKGIYCHNVLIRIYKCQPYAVRTIKRIRARTDVVLYGTATCYLVRIYAPEGTAYPTGLFFFKFPKRELRVVWFPSRSLGTSA
jgi:hypothetical protein